jgi:hypothetical protein
MILSNLYYDSKNHDGLIMVKQFVYNLLSIKQESAHF